MQVWIMNNAHMNSMDIVNIVNSVGIFSDNFVMNSIFND